MSLRRDYPDHREWTLDNYEVNFIHLDYRFGFDLLGFKASNGYLRVVVEVPFVLRDGNRETRFEPEDVTTIGGALQILHKLAYKVAVYHSGKLEVTFQDGLLLYVDKHEQYESWKAHGEGELADIVFLCSPHPGPPWRE